MTRKRTSKKAKRRIFLAFVIFGGIISWLSYSFFCNISKILEMKNEKEYLEKRMVELKNEEEILKSDIQKLKDPTYIARYAREKYLYSKDGELIIRIPDE